MSHWRSFAKKLTSCVVGAPVVATCAFCMHENVRKDRFAVTKIRTLEPDSRKHVVVIGGGIVGIASAYFLTLKGLQVTVLERASGAGQGTSSASGCLLSVVNCKPTASPQYLRRVINAFCTGDPWLEVKLNVIFDLEFIRWAVRVVGACFSSRTQAESEHFLRRHSPYFVRLIHDIAEYEGFTGEFCSSQNGLLTVYSNDVSFEAAQKAAEASGATALSREQVFQREPFLKSSSVSVAGAIYAPSDQHGDCGRFTELLANACENHGAFFRYSSPVASLRTRMLDNGMSEVVAVSLANGQDVEGDFFVVAMGSQSPQLLRPLGIDLPVYPVKGYSYEIDCGGKHGLKSPVVFVEHQLGAIPLGDRLRFSSVAEFAGWDEWCATPSVASRFRKDLEGLFPNIAGGNTLAGAKLIVGGRPTTPDDPPIVSGTCFPNLMVNTGHCMRGWRTACGTSAVLAALVTSSPTPNDVDAKFLALDRFRSIWRG